MMNVQLKDRKKVRMLIAQTGKSLRSFAKEIEVSQPYLSQILSGKKNPSVTIAYKIANGLSYEVEEIFLIKLIDVTNQKNNSISIKALEITKED